MPAPPPISILIPVRNGAAHLGEAIDSLESQTLPDFEVIVVDDGSTDDTPEMLHQWAGRDPRVRVLRQAPEGIVKALEVGRAEARGDFLARMDADDVADPRRLALQFAHMRDSPGTWALGSQVEYFPDEVVRDGARRYQAWMNASLGSEAIERELFVECPLAHPTFFLRAEAVAAIGGYRDVGWAEDYDLLLRLWMAGGRLDRVPEVLLHWRESPDRLSRRHDRYSPEAFCRCKVHYLIEGFGLKDRACLIWGAGPVGKAFSRAFAAEGIRVAGFSEVDPRKIGQEIHGAPVFDTRGALNQAGVLHLCAVGQPGARATLRSLLVEAGRVEMRDFVAVA